MAHQIPPGKEGPPYRMVEGDEFDKGKRLLQTKFTRYLSYIEPIPTFILKI
jgi:hypothetical protein